LDPLDKMPAAPHAVGEPDLNDSPLTGRGYAHSYDDDDDDDVLNYLVQTRTRN
jgi:hypothetical protein